MTLVNIDITGVASSTGPDDRVVLRAPAVRERSGGGLLSTREEVVTLVDGVGSVELEPGPVMVKFLCEGISDTGEKLGVVPDAGPVTLAKVIEAAMSYSPELQNQILDAIRDARDDALALVDAALEGELMLEAYISGKGGL